MLLIDLYRASVKLNQRLVFLLLFFIPLAINTQMAWPHRAPKELLLQLGCVWIVFTTILTGFKSRQNFVVKFNGIDLSILLYFAFIFFAYLFIPQYQNSFRDVTLLLCLAILYFSIQEIAINKKFYERVFGIILASGVILAIYGVSQNLGFDPFHPDNYQYYESEVIGTLGNANRLGGFLAGVLPFAWYYLKKNRYRRVYFIIILIILSALALTLCRGAWIAAFGGMVIVFLPEIKKIFLRLNSHRNLLIAYTILILLILGTAFYYIVQINNDSAKGRLFLWKVSLEMTKDFPLFGVGYGNYPAEYLNYQAQFFANPKNVKYFDRAANIKQAHNQFIHILAETGIPGLLFFLFIIGLFFAASARILKLKTDHQSQQTILALLASVSSILIHCLIDSPLQVILTAMVFFVCLSLMSKFQKKIVANLRSNPNNQQHNSSLARLGVLLEIRQFDMKISSRLKTILTVCYFGITVYACTHIYYRFQGFIYWKTAQTLANRNQLQKSKQAHLKAISKLSDVGELHFNLGGVYTKLEEYELAITEFELAQINFNDKNIPISMGVAYEGLNKNVAAEKQFLRAVSMYPKLLLPRYLLACLYYKEGKIERSKEMLNEIGTIIPGVESPEIVSIKNAAKGFLKTINE